MYINKAMIFGNLTRDPELRSLPSGQPVTTFSVATNRVWKDKSGARQESSDYHNVVVFGSTAENVSRYLHKGDSVYVEGRMQTRSWDAADGQKKSRTEIVADKVQFGPKREGGGQYSATPAQSGGKKAAKPAENGKSAPDELATIEYPEEDINPDDIPF